MGMYTEFHFNVELVKNVPDQVLDILRYMAGDTPYEPTDLPDHALFRTQRWGSLMLGDSYYFSMKPASQVRYDDISRCWYLDVRSNLKNYGGEIQEFLNWIMPHVDASTECLGYYRYEESDDPTLIYKNKTVEVGR